MALWWLGQKILGIIFILIGGFLVFFFPAVSVHQNPDIPGMSFSKNGVIIGFVLLVVGGFLLLS